MSRRLLTAALLLLALAPRAPAAVLLAWDPPDACAGCGVPDGYALFRRAGTAPYTEQGHTPATTLTLVDTPPVPGTYTYHVRALYKGLYSDGSNEVTVTLTAAPPPPPPPAGPPGPPRHLTGVVTAP